MQDNHGGISPYTLEDQVQSGGKRLGSSTSLDGKFGLSWREFGAGDRIVTKSKFFKSEAEREKFAEKLEAKDNFYEFDSWSDG